MVTELIKYNNILFQKWPNRPFIEINSLVFKIMERRINDNDQGKVYRQQ